MKKRKKAATGRGLSKRRQVGALQKGTTASPIQLRCYWPAASLMLHAEDRPTPCCSLSPPSTQHYEHSLTRSRAGKEGRSSIGPLGTTAARLQVAPQR